MKEAIADIINYYKPPFMYDSESGGYVFDQKGKMIMEIRGWGMLSSIMSDDEAWSVQNRIGEFIVGLLNKSLDATPEPEPGMRWVMASERPPDVTRVLAYTGGLVITLTFIDGVYYTGDGNKWCNPVTHWMPRPAPPGSLS